MSVPGLGSPVPPARVVVVAGPSGAGKSVLCRRLSAEHGWPVVTLDDFYLEGRDPSLPRRGLPGGAAVVDWDDPASWRCSDAVAALVELCRSGEVEVPVYDIAANGRVGSRVLRTDGAAFVLAEGIFSDRVVAPLRAAGLLADAVCVRHSRVVTFWRRLTRDLREARKPPWLLVRRGLALAAAEPAVAQRAVGAGCVVLSPDAARRRCAALTA